jgi:hypothetical protein
VPARMTLRELVLGEGVFLTWRHAQLLLEEPIVDEVPALAELQRSYRRSRDPRAAAEFARIARELQERSERLRTHQIGRGRHSLPAPIPRSYLGGLNHLVDAQNLLLAAAGTVVWMMPHVPAALVPPDAGAVWEARAWDFRPVLDFWAADRAAFLERRVRDVVALAHSAE